MMAYAAEECEKGIADSHTQAERVTIPSSLTCLCITEAICLDRFEIHIARVLWRLDDDLLESTQLKLFNCIMIGSRVVL